MIWDWFISNEIGFYWIRSDTIRSDNMGLDQIGHFRCFISVFEGELSFRSFSRGSRSGILFRILSKLIVIVF